MLRTPPRKTLVQRLAVDDDTCPFVVYGVVFAVVAVPQIPLPPALL